MRWFGGFNNPTAPVPPVHTPDQGSAWPSVPDLPGCWRVGQWAGHEFRTTRTGRRTVAVIGPCGMTRGDLHRLGVRGVPDDVAWRWPGSYTTVEVTGEGVRVWTDLGGAWPIYFTREHGGVYWASSSRALADLIDAGPDLDRLAASLVVPTEPLLSSGRSAFGGVRHVRPGHRLTVSASLGTAIVRRVWSPRPRSGSAAERLRAELAAAVAVRADAACAPTVDLSGGFDSTALAMLAHKAARDDQTVTGVTVYPVGHVSGGDLDYARRAAEHSGITHRLLPLHADHAPYTDLSAVPMTDEPAPSTVAHARFSAQLHWMRDTFGTDCHMTGDGGDSLLCSPPIMLADLLAAGRSWRGVVETLRWARLRRLPLWPLLRSAHRTSRATRADSLSHLSVSVCARAMTNSAEGDIGWCAAETPPPWATPDALARVRALASVWQERVTEPDPGSFAATLAADGMAEVGRSARADVQLAETVGVPLHNPYTDSRVVDTYLSVPLDERPGPAEYKPVLRDALGELFPAELAARRTKGDFNGDHYGGMRANLAALHELADGRLAELDLVDPATLRRTLTMTAAGLPGPFSSVEPAVAAETWLRAWDDAPKVAWSPVRTTEGAA